jgi:hypothetical protein
MARSVQGPALRRHPDSRPGQDSDKPQERLCQQFTVLHIRLSYQLRFSQKVIWKVK